MKPTEISGVQSSWAHSENESTGGLQQQRLERFLFVEKRRERLHGGMQGDLETCGPVGQVGDGVFVSFLYCLRAEMSLRCQKKFPGKERCLLDHFWNLLQSVLQ
jgi:hypothetical protein